MKQLLLFVQILVGVSTLISCYDISRILGGRSPDRRLGSILQKHQLGLSLKLKDHFPAEAAPVLESLKEDHECYDQSVGVANGTGRVNVLHDNVGTVLRGYLKANSHLFGPDLSKDELYQRLDALSENIRKLSNRTVKCASLKLGAGLGSGKPVSKLGLTSMAIYTWDEFQRKFLNPMLNEQLAPPPPPPPSPLLQGSAFTLDQQIDAELDEIVRTMEQDLTKPDTSICATTAEGCGGAGRRCNPTPWSASEKQLPALFDWNQQGYVTPVYMQGSCSSCYVFATTSALESQYLINVQKSPQQRFSEQATLNCMPYGCQGGLLPWPLARFVSTGVTLYQNAPYVSGNTNEAKSCTSYPISLRADSYCYHDDLSDVQMQTLIQRTGPAGVGIQATWELQMLKNSPYHGPCEQKLNHAVMIAGWDEQYWRIKNSWSADWGINGWLYLPRGQNKCGVNKMFGQPVVNRK